MKKLIISEEADLAMRNHASSDYPDECCGFFFGYETDNERVILKSSAVTNSKEGDKRRRFEISPFDYMKAEALALRENTRLLGVYHSHPDHPAKASEHDLKQAMPWFSYVIYSVMKGKIADVRSWQLNEDGSQFEEEEVETLATAEEARERGS